MNFSSVINVENLNPEAMRFTRPVTYIVKSLYNHIQSISYFSPNSEVLVFSICSKKGIV